MLSQGCTRAAYQAACGQQTPAIHCHTSAGSSSELFDSEWRKAERNIWEIVLLALCLTGIGHCVWGSLAKDVSQGLSHPVCLLPFGWTMKLAKLGGTPNLRTLSTKTLMALMC